MKKIFQGAEAIIYEDGDSIIKKRIKKGYRHEQIDYELRSHRTTREANILAKSPVNSPKLISTDKKEMAIKMEKIKGKKISQHLEKLDYKSICKEIGKMASKLHSKNIIHGDLTTSNMILGDDGKLYLIDFGLGYHSTKDEDKAVDLHLFRRALESKHHTICDECFRAAKEGYADRDVIKRLEIVEMRGRNKAKSSR